MMSLRAGWRMMALTKSKGRYLEMKKMLVLLLSILVTISGAVCPAIADENLIIGKRLDSLIEKATQPNGTGTAQDQPMGEKLGVPQSYTAELADPNGKVSIHVNADVQIPDVKSVSLQRVERERITQAQVDTLVSQLMSGDMFSGFAYKLSKSEIQQQIAAIEAAQQSGKSVEKKTRQL